MNQTLLHLVQLKPAAWMLLVLAAFIIGAELGWIAGREKR